MKVRMIVKTPLGDFYGKSEEATEKELQDTLSSLKDVIGSLSCIHFETEENKEVILPKDILKNSAIIHERLG